jgi:hypothetical protein
MLGVAALAIAGGGCGDRQPAAASESSAPGSASIANGSAATDPPDFLLAACDWFPREEAESLVPGIALARVRAPADQALGVDFAKCAWGAGPPTAIRILALEVRRHESAASAAAAQADARPVLRRLVGEQLAEVPQVGDGALWGGDALRQLHVVSGDVRMIITVQIGPAEAARGVAEKIARAALLGLDEARRDSRGARRGRT